MTTPPNPALRAWDGRRHWWKHQNEKYRNGPLLFGLGRVVPHGVSSISVGTISSLGDAPLNAKMFTPNIKGCGAPKISSDPIQFAIRSRSAANSFVRPTRPALAPARRSLHARSAGGRLTMQLILFAALGSCCGVRAADDARVLSRPVIATPARPSTNAAASTHWSFQSVKRPTVPRFGRARSKIRNEVDAFVTAKLPEKSVSLRTEADPRTLIRRVYFDLTGLPPSPEEVAAFIADRDPKAYERLVDRLLASPHYGERWGRHWLDVAGFAESSMFIGDVTRQGFWRYRDYVIRAFNADKPFNQFITEQLAGDELFNWRAADEFTGEQIEQLAATGFLRCPPDATDNQAITQMDKRYIAQQSAVEVSMKTLLGLTINCVRCHDHKFDPIQQEEYYRLIAVFQPAYDP